MPSHELIDGDLAGGDGLLEKTEEEQATMPSSPSVEAEGELVEVVVEVVDSHSALVGTQQPALKQRGDTMDCGHRDMGRLLHRLEGDHLVPVACRDQTSVAGKAIGTDGRTTLKRGGGEVGHRRDGEVGDPGHPYSTELHASPTFDSDCHDRLRVSAAAEGPWLRAAHVCLVHLDIAEQLIPARSDHRPSQFVQPAPGCLVAAQAEHRLEPQRADTLLLPSHVPGGCEPGPKQRMGVREDSDSGHRRLPLAAAADPQATLAAPALPRRTSRAYEPVRPAQPLQVLPASAFIREPRLEFLPRPGVVSAGDGTPVCAHAHILGLLE